MQSVHEGKKPFKCDICDANFTQKPNLKQHIESDNEGKKPFKCDMCDTSFVFKHYLQGHIASIHENRKPFTSNVKFAVLALLKNQI